MTWDVYVVDLVGQIDINFIIHTIKVVQTHPSVIENGENGLLQGFVYA